MKYFLLIISFLLVIGVFSRDVFIHHELPIPTDALVGLYHPYIDLFSSEYPRGVPFKNSLITDPVRQQIPWKSLVSESWQHMQLPLWNPYNLSGTPLLANFQSGAFYGFNKLSLILPFATAWTIYILSQPILAGLFMFLFLRVIKVSLLGSLIGGLIFSLCGFNIAWMEWGNVGHTLLWLPLILFVKEKLLEKWRWQYVILFIAAELCALFAGHLQVWFYTLLVSNSYLFIRVYQVIKAKQKKVTIVSYAKAYLPFFLCGIVMFSIGSFQLIPTFQFIFNSARDVDQSWMTIGWFLPWQNLVQFIAPDYFGNPATLNYWGVWNYGEFVGYISVGGLLLALFGFAHALIKKSFTAIYFVAVVLISLIAMTSWIGAQLPFILQLPFISSSQPTRLMAIVDFSLAILVAIGWDSLSSCTRKQKIIVTTIFVFFFVLAWGSYLLLPRLHVSAENILVTKRNLLPPTILMILSLGALYFLQLKQDLLKKLGILAFVIIIAFDLIRFGDKFESFSPERYFYPSTKTLSFLQKNIGNNRVMVLDDRILPPNVNAYYHIPTVSGYDPLYSLRYAQFIAMMERNKPDVSSPFGFNRIITPKSYSSEFINLLGVKYILSLDNMSGFLPEYTEGQTKIYRNPSAFPRQFFVSGVISVQTTQDAAKRLFAIKSSLRQKAVVEGLSSKEFSIGKITLIREDSNIITLFSENTGDGFLLMTDSYYPSWRAYIDGKETKIYPTDITFRGIVVPAGKHKIVFKDSLW